MSQPQRAARAQRTHNDVSALCVELLRAVREQEFRAAHAGGAAPSVDRAWRAWRTDLDRHGPLHLRVDDRGLRADDDPAPVGRGRLEDLARRLRERVLASVVFEPGLDAPTYAAFVSLLVAEPDAVEGHGGATSFLPERGVGIRVCEADEDAVAGEEKPEAPETEPKTKPAREPAWEPVAALDETGPIGDPDATIPALGGDPDATQPVPGPRPAADDPLAALTACGEDAAYAAAVTRLVTDLADGSDADPRSREALLLLAEHADPVGGRSDAQRAAALAGLRELGTGRRVAALLEHAITGGRDEAARAGRALRALAEQAGPALISAIDVQNEPGRREDLLALAVSLGRAATPALHRAMEGRSANRARIAARIAGEVRDERTVPTLAKLLEHREADVRGEAARALARIGNVSALTTLKRGLESSHDDVSSLCAWCLGVSGGDDAAQALTDTLRQARRARRNALAAAVIRSLGRLGREESVPELTRIVQKRSFFRRQELHELKLQSISALAQVPGARALAVLEAVATGSDMSLAVAARRALKERREAKLS